MTYRTSLAALCLLALIATACSTTADGAADQIAGSTPDPSGGSPAADATGADGGGGEQVVDGGTFSLAMAGDPGALDPHLSADAGLLQLTQLAYDPLVGMDPEDGTIVTGLATSWDVTAERVELTLDGGATCADGSPFTATDAADNLNFVADPENGSPFLGLFVPAGATATGDDDTGTVTLELAAPAPFVLQGLSLLPMVCRAGLDDRDLLRDQTAGTGPYVLTAAVPDDRYTYALREGYAWGPDGASTDEPGMPDEIVVQIVANATTAANLLLSGSITAAQIIGPEATRLEAADLFVSRSTGVLGELWFNQAEGRAAADADVRLALASALDLAQLRAVLTSDTGAPPTTFAVSAPAACPGESVPDALPAHDPELAAELLDGAGWEVGPDGTRQRDGEPLSLTLLLDNALGAGGTAAAELAVQQWRAVGVEATASAQTGTAVQETVFGGGDWDAVLLPLNVSSPDQLVPFMSGPTPPDGTNFASIANEGYEELVAEASAMIGVEGCDTWLAAEAELVEAADVLPFANSLVPTFGNGATFATAGQIIPTSIRMVAR